MGSITITFRGICTHFHHGHIPGVPHRVVLPDAAALRFGEIRMPSKGPLQPTEATYYTLPHFPFLHRHPLFDDAPPGLPLDGLPLFGATVRVVNAIEQEMRYGPDFESRIRSLRDFVPDFEPSKEVVRGERAAAHVDIHGGEVSVIGYDVPIVTVRIETDGPPLLEIVPFRRVQFFENREIQFDTDDAAITIANLEIDRPDDAPQYDYILHYLNDRRGVPVKLTQALPGMSDHPTPIDFAGVAKALEKLGEFLATPPEQRDYSHVFAFDVTPSCADSRFP